MSEPEAALAPPARVLEARERAELIVSAERVQFAIDQTAVRLAARLTHANPVLLCVMQGGLMYAGELARRLQFPLQLGYVHVGRYRDATSGGVLDWIAKPNVDIAGRHVLLVDDILDQGVTLNGLLRWLGGQGASAITTTVLVNKEVQRAERVAVDFAAVSCPDRFLIGCGMDYQGYWRNLPAIYALPRDMEDAH